MFFASYHLSSHQWAELNPTDHMKPQKFANKIPAWHSEFRIMPGACKTVFGV